jgi:3-deoxy-D-arabino-heptulosonate 7-phosphate (DAHP) synthase
MKFLITAFICFGIVSIASGQSISTDSITIPRSYWVSGGVGLSTLGSASAGLVANAEIKNRILISAGWIGETSEKILDFSTNHSVNVSSFNALAGKIYKQRNSLISFSAGLGLVRLETRDTGGARVSSVTETTIGIPLLVQAHAIGFQAIGVGLNLYGNLNMKQSTTGIHLSIALGRIATRQKR